MAGNSLVYFGCSFGEAIKNARLVKGLTRRGLAAKCLFLSEHDIEGIENNETHFVPFEKADAVGCALANALDLAADEIVRTLRNKAAMADFNDFMRNLIIKKKATLDSKPKDLAATDEDGTMERLFSEVIDLPAELRKRLVEMVAAYELYLENSHLLNDQEKR